jgi:hypothetical protein
LFSFANLRKRFNPTPTADYHRGDVFLPGAENAVYEPAYPIVPAMLPALSITGTGVFCGRAPNPQQLPQVWANQTAFISGVGGPLSGGLYNQPLQVPETTNGSQ